MIFGCILFLIFLIKGFLNIEFINNGKYLNAEGKVN